MKKIVVKTPDGKFTWEPSRETQEAIKKAGFSEADVVAALQDSFWPIFQYLEALMIGVATSDVTNPGSFRALVKASALRLRDDIQAYLGKPRT